jgi:hypothetical protein
LVTEANQPQGITMNDLNWNDYFDNDRECGGFDDIEDDLELSIINAKSYINRKAKTKAEKDL